MDGNRSGSQLANAGGRGCHRKASPSSTVCGSTPSRSSPLTRWGIDAHMGILFGLPNQLLLAAFGLGLCLMIVLGYRMWWSLRPAAGRASGADAGRRPAGAFLPAAARCW